MNSKKIAKRVKERAGLPEDFRPLHGLRHTFASWLASSGEVDLYTLQRLLTHNSPQMTQRYAHLADSALQRAASVPRPSFEPNYAANAAADNGEKAALSSPATTITTTTQATTTITTDLPAVENNILAFIRQNPEITLKDLAAKLKLTKDGVRYHTDNLQKRGLLRRSGTYKGHWEILA